MGLSEIDQHEPSVRPASHHVGRLQILMNVSAPMQGLDRIEHVQEKTVERLARVRHRDVLQAFRDEIRTPLVLAMAIIPGERAVRLSRRKRRREQFGLVFEPRLQVGIVASAGDLDRDGFMGRPIHPFPDIRRRAVREKAHEFDLADDLSRKAGIAGGGNVEAALCDLREDATRQVAHHRTSRASRNAL